MSSKRKVEEMRFRVPWGHVAAKAWGSPQATRVFVAHGISDNAGSFDRIMPMLPENFYYVVVDLPGHGLSSPLPSGIQLDFMNYVLAVRLVLDQLKWDSCIYIGHSFGSQLGMFMSILYPERIKKLVCLDGMLPMPIDNNLLESIRLIHETAVKALSAQSPPLYTRDEILYALKNRRTFSLNSAAAEALFVRATTSVGDKYKYNRDFRMRTLVNPLFSNSQYKHLLEHLKIPVLIILAESSWFHSFISTTAFQKAIDGTVANVTIATVPGNHDVHNNNPEVVAPHVSAFLNGVSKSKL